MNEELLKESMRFVKKINEIEEIIKKISNEYNEEEKKLREKYQSEFNEYKSNIEKEKKNLSKLIEEKNNEKENLKNNINKIEKELIDINSKFEEKDVHINDVDIEYTISRVQYIINFLSWKHNYNESTKEIDAIVYRIVNGEEAVVELRSALYRYMYRCYQSIFNTADIYVSDLFEVYDITPIFTKDFIRSEIGTVKVYK
jgi:chromosome segregation ATPase